MYSIYKQLPNEARFRVARFFVACPLSNIQTSLRVLREAGTLPRSPRIKWGAGTPDAPLQLPSGTESMLMNAALAPILTMLSGSRTWRVKTGLKWKGGLPWPEGCGGVQGGN